MAYVDPERLRYLLDRVAELTDGDEEQQERYATGSEDDRLLDLYREAGWAQCYHDSDSLHYNVKLGGYDAIQGLSQTLDRFGLDDDDRKQVETIADDLQAGDLEVWWRWTLDDELDQLGYADERVYSCGRSGGYVQVGRYQLSPEAMIRLANSLRLHREGFNCFDYGWELAVRALEAWAESTAAVVAEQAARQADENALAERARNAWERWCQAGAV